MKTTHFADTALLDRCSTFMEALKRDEPRVNEEFGAWLRESVHHMDAFLMMTALEEELRCFDPQRLHQTERFTEDRAEVVQLERYAVAPVTQPPMPDTKAEVVEAPAPQSRYPNLRWYSLAAIVLAAVGIFMLMGKLPGFGDDQHAFATTVGEQRSIPLNDGSVVRLNTQSRIKVKISETKRDIQLLDGEALFKVRHETARPFVVHIGPVAVQATGTQFNIYRHDGGATVSVLEGTVQISGGSAQRVALAAGQEVEIDPNGAAGSPRSEDIKSMAAWTDLHFSFEQTELAKIVAEFNRYRVAPKFRIVSSEVAKLKFSGTLELDDPQSLGQLLNGEPTVAVQTTDDEIVIRSKAPPATQETAH